MTNDDISRALRELALRLEMDGVQFKPRALEKAASSIAAREEPVAHLAESDPKALEKVPGVGGGIARRVVELVRTGHITELDALRRALPADVLMLTAIEGVGPKHVKAFYEQLGVR